MKMRGSFALGLLAALAALSALVVLAAPAGAQEAKPDAKAPEAAAEVELGPEARACLDGGLKWLSDHQGEGGVVRGERGTEAQDVASTALAGLAWLATGSTERRGPYARNVENALDYVLRAARPGPKNIGAQVHDEGRSQGRMHAHGFATLFLAELYGMSKGGGREDRAATIRDTLKRAVLLSVRSQTQPRLTWGGWGYAFAGEQDFGYDEASTTITQIQALRAARNAGIEVPIATIDRAVEYVKRCMRKFGSLEAGNARYSLTMGGGDPKENERTSFELTAAACTTLHASGVYRSAELDAGLKVLRKYMSKKPNRLQASEAFQWYGTFYASQAMFQAGGEDWTSWFRDAQAELVSGDKLGSKRDRKGNVFWEDPRSFGDAYATATACLVLSIPLRYLPIFER